MILEPNRIAFGVRSNATNLESMRRLGVAVYSSDYTAQERVDLLKRVIPPKNANDPELKNFDTIMIRGGVDVLIGHIQCTDAQWNRLSSFIRDLLADIGGATVKYVRFDLSSGVSLLTNDHNFSELNGMVGTPMTIAEAIPIVGLSWKGT